MRRRSRLLLVLAVVVGLAAVVAGIALGRSRTPDPAVGWFCAAVDSGLPAVDDPDAADAWRAIAETLPGPHRDDAEIVRVAAEQIEALGPDAGIDRAAALALRPEVVGALLRLADLRRSACP
jgi:hypothetical protein